MKVFKFLFAIEKKPRKGLLAAEWVVMGYLLLTTLLVLFTITKAANPEAMLWWRFGVVITTMALWLVYRLVPCPFTHFCRLGVQMLMLASWYPDTYELNRIFPNLDHHFASYEQQLWGCQPALLFSQALSHPVFSELMSLGYASYYLLIGVVTLFTFFFRYKEFDRTVFVILTSFFIYYVIFIFLPVTGPQYYYLAAGLENIAAGIFPDLGNYFNTCQEALPIPGWRDGFFYQMVENAHVAGERPTAAFPSSHVGVTTILLFIVWRLRNRWLFWGIIPFYVLMCLATVYIQAHYAVDVIGGWVSAVVIYGVLHFFWGKICAIKK